MQPSHSLELPRSPRITALLLYLHLLPIAFPLLAHLRKLCARLQPSGPSAPSKAWSRSSSQVRGGDDL